MMRTKTLRAGAILLAVLLLSVLSFPVFAAEALAPQAELAPGGGIGKTLDYAGKLILLQTGDVHGALEGYSRVSGLKTQYENAGAHVLLLDTGDFSRGSSYVDRTLGMAAVKLMNELRYSLSAVGNRAFDGDLAMVKKLEDAADFPLICANVTDKNGKPMFTPHVILEESGLRIGFTGFLTPETQLLPGMKIAAGKDLYRIAQAELEALSDCDVKIAVTHLGFDGAFKDSSVTALYKNVPGFDIILDGHSHEVTASGRGGEPIQSVGAEFSHVGEVVIDILTGKVESNRVFPLNSSVPVDLSVEELTGEIMQEIDEGEPIPETGDPLFMLIGAAGIAGGVCLLLKGKKRKAI